MEIVLFLAYLAVAAFFYIVLAILAELFLQDQRDRLESFEHPYRTLCIYALLGVVYLFGIFGYLFAAYYLGTVWFGGLFS